MRRLVLSLVAAPLLLASGCGAPPADGLSDAARRTAEAGSARVSWTIETEGERWSFQGAIDFERGTGQLAMKTREGNTTSDFDLRFADDGKTYGRLNDELDAAPGATGKWFRLGDTSDWGSFATAAVPLPGAGRPDELIELFRFTRGVEVTENETVHGVPATHYRATLDVTALLDANAPIDGSWEEELRKIDELPLEAWIDGDGFARRVILRFPAIADEEAGTLTIELSDFDVTVDAPPPPVDETDGDESGSVGILVGPADGSDSPDEDADDAP